MGDNGQPLIGIAQQVFGVIEPRARIKLSVPDRCARFERGLAARADNAEFIPQRIVKFFRRVDGPAQQAGIVIGGLLVQLYSSGRE
ncbi:hypothetical protein D3C80_1510840 [compost metagenome]